MYQASRKTLLNLIATYSMGVFNDNFYKQTVLLLATSAGLLGLQGKATVFFALPFMLFSAWAGWLTDNFSKPRIVIFSKFFEFLAMLFGLWVLYSCRFELMAAVVFIMSSQSAFFSPALNGSIPEYFEISKVPRVNSLVKLITTVFILLGIAFSGFILDFPAPNFASKFISEIGDRPFGRLCVGLFAIMVSLIGIITAMRMGKQNTTQKAKRTFPLFGPFNSVIHSVQYLKKDPELFLVLFYEAYFYSVSSAAVLGINNLGIKQLSFSFSATSILSVALMLGIGAGSLKAGRYQASHWQRLFIPAGILIGSGLIAANLVVLLPQKLLLPYLLLLFMGIGFAGGLYLIPFMSYIQVKPHSDEKGKVLGVSNFFAFSGILIAGALFGLIPNNSDSVLFAPSMLLAYCGFLTIVLMKLGKWWLYKINGLPLQAYCSSFIGAIVTVLLELRYKITIIGLDKIPARGHKSLLFLPNHPALIDPVIMCAVLKGLNVRPLADKNRMDFLLGRFAKKLVNPILLPDISVEGRKGIQAAKNAIHIISDTLKQGGNILLYPTGQLRRGSMETPGTRSALVRILNNEVRPIFVKIKGLWGSSFSTAHTKGETPNFAKVFSTNLLRLLLNGVFFIPKREVTIEFSECENFPKNSSKTEINCWLENFYEGIDSATNLTPYYFWKS